MTTSEVQKLLNSQHVRKYKGAFRYHQSYYWGFTDSADKLVEKVKAAIPSAKIIDSGNHWHEFVGGAKSGSAKDSFLWVTFKVD